MQPAAGTSKPGHPSGMQPGWRQRAVVGMLILPLSGASALAATHVDLLDLSLEQLANVQISGIGSLTETRWNQLPASVTRISANDIAASGARSLDQLLEIFVPGLQVWLKTNADQIGLRGIISDRNTKLLLLVNGRQMNEHTSLGVFSERFLSMLGDIESINVIRGPGSHIYGPGAIAGVIHIKTLDGQSFRGEQAQIRTGAVEKFVAAEYKNGSRLDNGGHLFFYYGVDQYQGADSDDATLQFSSAFTNNVNGETVNAYQPVPFQVADYRQSHRDQLRHKLHLDYRQGDALTWVRYTRGGNSRDLSYSSFASIDPALLPDESYGYQQLTATTEYRARINPVLVLDSRVSYDILDLEYGNRNYREDELALRLLARWRPTSSHQLASGVEISREYLGKKSLGYPGGEPSISTALTALDSGEWITDSKSLLLDYQWQLQRDWTLFLGTRADHHTYTNWLHSPRLALLYAASDYDQLKLLLSRSVRRAEEDTLREYYLQTGDDDGRHEQLDALELSWEHQWDNRSRAQASLFFNDYDLIAWDSSANAINAIGNLKTLGLELEGHLRFSATRLSLLYTYTRELDFSLASADVTQFVSASVYGYGDDLANWSQHAFKLIHQYRFSPQWSSFTALRTFWGLDGSAAMADYNLYENNNSVAILPNTDGSGKAYGSRSYLDLGLAFQYAATTVRLNSYNILGWRDKEYNRRNTFSRSGQYRTEAAAVALSVTLDF